MSADAPPTTSFLRPLAEDLQARREKIKQGGGPEKIAKPAENQPHEPEEHARYMRDTVIPAMAAMRGVADRLERIVADYLWPLPRYSEILFIK